MPTGIIIKSASHEESDAVRDANVKAVIESAGYEVPEPEPPAEPKREDFKTEEEFESAHVDWQDKEDEKAAKAEEEEPVAPKKSRRTRAIERAVADKERRIKELEEQLAAKGGAPAAKVEEPPKEAARPRRADFANDEAYEDALLAWGSEKAIKQKALADAQAAQRAEDEQILMRYGAMVEEAKDKYEDWDEVVGGSQVNIGVPAQLSILELENAAEVVYYLCRHPTYATKLAEMRPNSAIMEVGRLSAKLLTGASSTDEANPEVQTRTKPKVPAPVRTVNTGSTSSSRTFADLAAGPNYPGKAKDLRRLQFAEK